MDGEAFGREVVEIVRGYVERELAPLKAENESLLARVAELEARPLPEKGEKGDPGEKGEPGEPGKDGANGIDGKDGRGVKELLIDRDGVLVASMDDGEMKALGPVVGRDGEKGEPGKDGEDGFDLDDFDVQPVDERTIKLMYLRGDTCHSFELEFPVPIYRGVYKAGETYSRGDLVTWGGSLHHCDRETSEKPDSKDWSLAARKGRDAKNG